MITIQNGMVLYGSEMEPINANVLIEDNIITEVSSNACGGREIDAKGCIVAPALINSHVHLGDSVAKDRADGEKIEKIVKPPNGIKHQILEKTPKKSIIVSMRNSILEMLDTGTTTMVDFREGGIEGLQIAYEASKGIPIRRIVLGRHESFFNPSNKLEQLREASKLILNSSDGIGLSGFGEINDDVVKIITETCNKYGKISAIHAAEYEEVQIESLKATGKTEVDRALNAGFKLLIHLTHPKKDDLDILAEKNVPVVSCPRSNGSLAVGIPPLKEMWDKGINLLLGTDNIMFNSPNMFREMEYALKVTRGYYRQYFSPLEILKMATVNPGRFLNLNLGYIEEGMLSDIMLVDQLSTDPILSLLNRTESKNIIGLITDGKVVYSR
jgi:cytosine/adenosine deaminase-related metal-dependent hydrolase